MFPFQKYCFVGKKSSDFHMSLMVILNHLTRDGIEDVNYELPDLDANANLIKI